MELWEEDLYELIGVEPEATADEIKKAYKKLAIELHPDRFAGKPEKEAEAAAHFSKITNAYNVLKDGEERAEYDFARRMGFGSNGGPPTKSKTADAAPPPADGAPAAPAQDSSLNVAKKSQAENQFAQGKIFHQSKNWQKAIAHYKEAAKIDPGVADYHAYLGLAYLNQGLKTPANKAFETAYKIDKKHKILKEHYDAPGEGGKGKGGLMAQVMGLLQKLGLDTGGDAKGGKKGKGKAGGKKKAGAKK